MNEIIKILSKVDGGNILDAATGKEILSIP